MGEAESHMERMVGGCTAVPEPLRLDPGPIFATCTDVLVGDSVGEKRLKGLCEPYGVLVPAGGESRCCLEHNSDIAARDRDFDSTTKSPEIPIHTRLETGKI